MTTLLVYLSKKFPLASHSNSILLVDRGWVGWKRTPERETVEILFEFDAVREFHAVHIFANNQFTRDVAVFKAVSVAFSVGGTVFSGEPVGFLNILSLFHTTFQLK